MSKNLPAGVLVVDKRNEYGNIRYYPVNVIANLFADIAGLKCISPEMIKNVGYLGYEVRLNSLDGEVVRG